MSVLQNEVLIIHSQERGIQTPTNTPSSLPQNPPTRVENNPGSSKYVTLLALSVKSFLFYNFSEK